MSASSSSNSSSMERSMASWNNWDEEKDETLWAYFRTPTVAPKPAITLEKTDSTNLKPTQPVVEMNVQPVVVNEHFPMTNDEKKTTTRRSRRSSFGRTRTVFSFEQILKMENLFTLKRYPTAFDFAELAQELQVHETPIKNWFCNRRCKAKQNGEVMSPPPRKGRPVVPNTRPPYQAIHESEDSQGTSNGHPRTVIPKVARTPRRRVMKQENPLTNQDNEDQAVELQVNPFHLWSTFQFLARTPSALVPFYCWPQFQNELNGNGNTAPPPNATELPPVVRIVRDK